MPVWTNQDKEIPQERLPQISTNDLPQLSGLLGFFHTSHSDNGTVLLHVNDAALDMYKFAGAGDSTIIISYKNSSFFAASKGASANSTVPGASNSYIVIDGTPNITYSSNVGGSKVPTYIRSLDYYLVGLQAATVDTIDGAYLRIVRLGPADPVYFNQFFVGINVDSVSGYQTEKGIDLLLLSGSTVYKLVYSISNPTSYTISILFTLSDTSDELCALDQSEVLVYSLSRKDFVVYHQNGTLLREAKANVLLSSTYRMRKEPVGCSVIYQSDTKDMVAMVYPLSNINFTNPLFLPAEMPGAVSLMSETTYTSVDGQIFFADTFGKIYLIYLRQNVTTLPTVQNTTDTIFQTTNYNMLLPSMDSKQQFFLFRNMTEADRFYVLMRNKLPTGSQTQTLSRVYTKPLVLTCKNPTYLAKEISKEYYFKIGAFRNPDARREKQIMMIIRKDSLTVKFEGAVNSPITWIAASTTAVAVGFALYFLITVTRNLTNINKVANAYDPNKAVDPASESLIQPKENAPLSLTSLKNV
jgi:hypothetical protein